MKFYIVRNLSELKPGVNLLVDNWDDMFSFETTFKVFFQKDNGSFRRIGLTKIGEQGLKGSREVKPGYRKPALPDSFEKLDGHFFSLGQEDEYYSNLKELNESIPGFRKLYLESINDLAFSSELYNRYRCEEVTKVSLMRSVSHATVINQFHRIANGGDILTRYEFGFQLPQHKDSLLEPQEIRLNVTPNSIPPTNMHIVIGRNGVGKTHLIKSLIYSTFMIGENSERGFFFNIITRDKMNSLDLFSNLICIGFSAFDDIPIDITAADGNSADLRYVFIGLDHISGQDRFGANGAPELSGAESAKRLHRINESFWDRIQSISKSDSKINLLRETTDFLIYDDLFKEHINDVFSDVFEPSGDSGHFDTENEHLYKERDEEKKVFQKLSSGHKITLLTIACLIDTVVEKSLIILDEPEMHLHPPLLSALMRAISHIIARKNGVALVMTHSPVLLQEVPANCTWEIRRSGSQVSIKNIGIETYGTDINTLMREVFGHEILKTGFHKALADIVKQNNQSYEQCLSLFNGRLGLEGMALLSTLCSTPEDANV